jgi:hypothetical protein
MSKKLVIETVRCPRCGADVPVLTNLDKPGWLVARCECNPIGPVYEAPMKQLEDKPL